MPEKKATATRTRNYATIVYPESAPDNWQGVLVDECVPALISPLHDKDKNPTGESKKPHYHVLLLFEGPKTRDQAKSVFDKIGGVGCETINSVRGSARYLCHLDNPDKAEYSPSDVVQLCGADYHTLISLPSDKYKAIREIMEFCEKYNLVVYADLLRWTSMYREDWYRVLCDNGTLVIKEYLMSMAWKQKNGIRSVLPGMGMEFEEAPPSGSAEPASNQPEVETVPDDFCLRCGSDDCASYCPLDDPFVYMPGKPK